MPSRATIPVQATATYQLPRRALLMRAANIVLGPLVDRGLLHAPLDEASIYEGAETRTGLLDMGDPSYREPFRTLIQSLPEAQLHPLGKFFAHIRLTSLVANRMRIEELYRTHHDVENERIEPPIVVTGLPQSGLRLAHLLLASDRRLRSLFGWEALNPAPTPYDNDRDARMGFAEWIQRALRYLNPDLDMTRLFSAQATVDDTVVLDMAFRSTLFEKFWNVPSYASFLERESQAPSYRYLLRVLRALQWQQERDNPPRWILRSSHHLEWLDEVFESMPDPLVVWLHRDPEEALAAHCHTILSFRLLSSSQVDAAAIGRECLTKFDRIIQRGLATRRRVGVHRFLDIRYRDLLERPVDTMRKIEERGGLHFGREAETAVRDAMRRTKPTLIEPPPLDAFGLDPIEVAKVLRPYREAFSA